MEKMYRNSAYICSVWAGFLEDQSGFYQDRYPSLICQFL